MFLQAYERTSGVEVADLREWDLFSAAYADTKVETWAPNYSGIGRHDVTAEVLRARLDEWNTALLRNAP